MDLEASDDDSATGATAQAFVVGTERQGTESARQGINGSTVIEPENRAKSTILCVSSFEMPWVCMVATMLASWICLPPQGIEASRLNKRAVTAWPSSAMKKRNSKDCT
jgi:hypothetical protein